MDDLRGLVPPANPFEYTTVIYGTVPRDCFLSVAAIFASSKTEDELKKELKNINEYSKSKHVLKSIKTFVNSIVNNPDLRKILCFKNLGKEKNDKDFEGIVLERLKYAYKKTLISAFLNSMFSSSIDENTLLRQLLERENRCIEASVYASEVLDNTVKEGNEQYMHTTGSTISPEQIASYILNNERDPIMPDDMPDFSSHDKHDPLLCRRQYFF